MAGGQEKEVALVIKAKDQAKKAIDSVADALRDFTAAQENASDGAKKADGLFGRLQNAFKDLDNEIKGLSALNKVATNLDRAATAVGQLDAKVKASAEQMAQLATAQSAAAANTAKLRQAAADSSAAYEKQRAAVAALTAEQKKDAEATAAMRAAVTALKKARDDANTAVNVAERQEEGLASQYARAQRTFDAQTVALAESNAELNEISAIAAKASSALGGVEATTAAVAAASLKATEAQNKLKASMGALSGSSSAGAAVLPSTAAGKSNAYRDQIAAVQQAKQAWADAQAEANRLAVAIKSAEKPTAELNAEFVAAQVASRAAKQEYLNQGAALNQLRSSLASARQATVAETAAEKDLSAAAQRAAGVVRSQVTSNTAAAASGLKLRDSFSAIYGESRQAMSLLQRFRGEVLSLASAYVGLYGAINAIGSVIDTAIQYQSVQNRLGVVFNQNAVLVRSEMQYLQEEAQRLGVRFTALATNYADFAVAANGANFSMQDTRRIFKALSESGVVLNVSADDMQGIFKALTQIMSKGSVQAEELRGQLGDRMTGAFKLMADAIGVTTGELDKMLKAGQVVADRSTLIKFADTVSDRYGDQLPKALKGLNAEIGRFQNNIVEAEHKVGEAGFTEALTTSLRELNIYFQSDEGQKFFENIGIALGKLIGVLPGVVENFDKFVLLFRVFATLKAAQVISGIVGSFGGLKLNLAEARAALAAFQFTLRSTAAAGTVMSGSARVLSGALSSMGATAVSLTAIIRGLWAAIGGLPGVIITALTFIISSFAGEWLTGIDNASKVLSEHERIVEKVQKGYMDAAGSASEWAKKIEGVTLLQAQQNLADLNKELNKNQSETAAASEGIVRLLKNADGVGDFAKQFQAVTDAYRDGKISADEYKNSLNALAQALPEGNTELRKILASLSANADKARETEKSIRAAGAVIDVLTGQAKGATAAALGLDQAMGKLNATASDTSGIDAYTAALAKLRGGVPTLKATDDKAAAIKEANATYEAAAALFQKKRTRHSGGALSTDPDSVNKLAALAAARDARLKAINAEYDTKISPPAKKVAKTDAQKLVDKQKEFNAYIDAEIQKRQIATDEVGREQEIQLALAAAQKKASDDGVVFDATKQKALRDAVGAAYDEKKAREANLKVMELTAQLADKTNVMESRADYISRMAAKDKIDLLTEEGKKYADLTGQIYDLAKIEDDRQKADKTVSDLQAQQQAIQAAIEAAKAMGDATTVSVLKEQLKGINEELIKALDAAIAFYKALDPATNPNAAAAIANMEGVKAGVQAIGAKVIVTGEQINESIADGAANAFDRFAQAVGEGKDAFQSAGDAFRQFASDFLKEIAQMIIKALILKAITGDANGGSGGLGGTIAGWINGAVKHEGGVAGDGVGPTRSVWSGYFANAMRYHTGGIVGLKPDEIPIIAQRGEGIFTEEQMKMMGQSGGSAKVTAGDTKIINVWNPVDLLKAALQDKAGQKVLINTLGDNQRAVNGALSR